MWKRIGRVLALFGLYALVLARIASQASSQFQVGLVEFAVVTLLFGVAAVYVVTRPVRAPLE